MSLETWMSYWLQPHANMYGKRGIREGVTIWVFMHPTTIVETEDILDSMMEDHPHLVDLLKDFEFVRIHRYILDGDGLAAAVGDEQGQQLVKKLVEATCVTGDDGQTVWTEFLEGKTKTGSLLSQDRDPTTHAILMDAYDQTCRKRGLSIMLNGDQEVMSVSGGGQGIPAKVEKIMGSKMIDAKLAEFREQLESWQPKGGES